MLIICCVTFYIIIIYYTLFKPQFHITAAMTVKIFLISGLPVLEHNFTLAIGLNYIYH